MGWVSGMGMTLSAVLAISAAVAACGEAQHVRPTGLYLHHVAHGLVKERAVTGQGHHQGARPR